jgi:hypothetical protein
MEAYLNKELLALPTNVSRYPRWRRRSCWFMSSCPSGAIRSGLLSKRRAKLASRYARQFRTTFIEAAVKLEYADEVDIAMAEAGSAGTSYLDESEIEIMPRVKALAHVYGASRPPLALPLNWDGDQFNVAMVNYMDIFSLDLLHRYSKVPFEKFVFNITTNSAFMRGMREFLG